MLKTIIKIFEKILFGLFIILIIIFGYYIIQRVTNKDKPAKMFGYYLYEVSSWSMYNEESEHSLSKGDLIFVKKLKDDEYQVGMVVTYDTGNNIPTTHMIIDRSGNTITTQGINKEGNTSSDAPFDVSKIIGEVKGVYRNYRSHMNFITSPLGIILVLGIGFIIIEGTTIINKKLNKNNDNKELKEE